MGAVLRFALFEKIFVRRSVEYQGPTSLMRSTAFFWYADNHATNVPSRPAASAAAWHLSSPPARPPSLPLYVAALTNTRFAPATTSGCVGVEGVSVFGVTCCGVGEG